MLAKNSFLFKKEELEKKYFNLSMGFEDNKKRKKVFRNMIPDS